MCEFVTRSPQRGARVGIVYLNRTEVAEDLARELRICGGAADARAFKADVTDAEAIASLVDDVVQNWGRLDVLVANAAFNQGVPFPDLDALTPDLWQQIMHANASGPFLLARAVAPVMRKQGSGRIVNIGSVSGYKPGSSIAIRFEGRAGKHLRMPRAGPRTRSPGELRRAVPNGGHTDDRTHAASATTESRGGGGAASDSG